jgi:hypothetical protein
VVNTSTSPLEGALLCTTVVFSIPDDNTGGGSEEPTVTQEFFTVGIFTLFSANPDAPNMSASTMMTPIIPLK